MAEPQTHNTAAAKTITPPPPVIPVGQSGDWDLLFSDEFDGTTLDTGKWTTCYWWDDDGCNIASNNELEWYQSDDVLVNNGTLQLRAQQRSIDASNGNTYDYTSGMVTTGRDVSSTSVPPKFAFAFGYTEIKAKIPKGQGLWPAFWLLPVDHNSKPEIDVMEILGNETDMIHFNFHYLNSEGVYENQNNDWVGPDFSDDWHTYAVDWQPDKIIWYVDGVEHFRYTETAYIPNGPMYLLANLAVGGDWPGDPNGSTPFPSYYEIDYMRVWQRSNEVYLLPIADTYTDSDSPSTNYGHDDSIQADHEPIKTTYLKFDTTALAGRRVASIQLQVKSILESGAGSPDTQYVKLVEDTTWQEDDITFDNAPAVSPTSIGSLSDTSSNSTYAIPLDTSQVKPKIGGVFSLAIEGTGTDGLYLYSKDNEFDKPYLIITLLSSTTVFLPIIIKP
ncbi:MAG: glycoside hydrolase family 16 protein [Anaerolineae bacterium]|nr:glycoside hydrolase family 16 protein [Anaerolineae bacterium]